MDWMDGLDARLISFGLQARGVRGHVGSHVGEGDAKELEAGERGDCRWGRMRELMMELLIMRLLIIVLIECRYLHIIPI
jgi:hypothetical protein